MLQNISITGWALALSLLVCSPALAGIEATTVARLNLEKPPIDVAYSQHDGRIFLLFDQGEVMILAANGQVQGRIQTEPGTSGLAISSDGSRLLLTDRANKTLKIVDVALVYNIPIGNSPIRGNPNAPVTITVFDDFQCPYCARLAPVLEQVLKMYPQQVRLVFKHFPLPNHAFAEEAAIASKAAQNQGKFWPMHDLLFANYNKLNADKIREIAESIGLDMQQFERDLDNPAYLDEINAEKQLGRNAEVRGTPSVYIDGVKLDDRSIGGFRTAIDKALR